MTHSLIHLRYFILDHGIKEFVNETNPNMSYIHIFAGNI